MSTPTVTDLQRELLAICKGGSAFTTWAQVNGMPINEHVSLRSYLDKAGRVRDLRRQIHALDPNAALYFGWLLQLEDRHRAEAEFFATMSTTGGEVA